MTARLGVMLAGLCCVWRLVSWVALEPASEAWGAVRGRSPTAGWTFDTLVTDALGSLALIAAGAFVATSALIVVRELVVAAIPKAAEVLPAVGPAGWRRMVLSACGLTIAIPTFAVPAVATDHPDIAPCPLSCSATPLGGLSLPDLPLSGGARDRHGTALQSTMAVRSGDSLWTIAERLVGPGASNAHISAISHTLYAANRAAIGADPDLIYPGTTLTLPGVKDDR
jgi:nucleoid-associated protein YgaU